MADDYVPDSEQPPTNADLEQALRDAVRGRELWKNRAIDARAALQRIVTAPENAVIIAEMALGNINPSVGYVIGGLLVQAEKRGAKGKVARRVLRQKYGVRV